MSMHSIGQAFFKNVNNISLSYKEVSKEVDSLVKNLIGKNSSAPLDAKETKEKSNLPLYLLARLPKALSYIPMVIIIKNITIGSKMISNKIEKRSHKAEVDHS